ncbi:MAG: ATP-binding cassette domain-containing protein [bacterium]|nr:ATP-binding cassette domain-containing protein [bacterium]MDE0418850.1 ATP-binding cassette domain-containing protein [bacterium]
MPALRMSRIVKRFGGILALDGVDFEVNPGEVMALVGDNGAGKSTLIKILAGAYQADAGTITLDGAPVEFKSPQDAWNRGIATIYQELALTGKMMIPDNIFLGRELKRRVFGVSFLDRRAMRERTKQLLSSLDVQVPSLDVWVELLSGGQRQGIAISRALNIDAELIVMDEPTAALAVAEVRKVLQFIRRLREQGKSVILISHNLQDVFAVSDRITVLRQGRRAGVRETRHTTPEEIIGLITWASTAEDDQETPFEGLGAA